MFQRLNGKKGLILVALVTAILVGAYVAQFYTWTVGYRINQLTSFEEIIIPKTTGATAGALCLGEAFRPVPAPGEVDAVITKRLVDGYVEWYVEFFEENLVNNKYHIGLAIATSLDEPDFQVWIDDTDMVWCYEDYPWGEKESVPDDIKVEGESSDMWKRVKIPIGRLGDGTFYWAMQVRTNLIAKYPESWVCWSGDVRGYAENEVSPYIEFVRIDKPLWMVFGVSREDIGELIKNYYCILFSTHIFDEEDTLVEVLELPLVIEDVAAYDLLETFDPDLVKPGYAFWSEELDMAMVIIPLVSGEYGVIKDVLYWTGAIEGYAEGSFRLNIFAVEFEAIETFLLHV